MLGKTIIRKSITSLIAVAVWSVFSMAVLAAPDDVMGEMTVSGQVTVDGQKSVSNSTVTSGSTIVTGTNSTATINLGKSGRVELLSDTTVTLKFTNNSIVGMLTAGQVRIANTAGIAATVTTRNATVIADTGQADTFSVDVGCSDEARCTQTHVDTTIGLVTLRSGSTDKQVAAGTDATYGNPSQTGCKPCLRPGSVPPVRTAGAGSLLFLIAAIGAVGTAIFFCCDNNVELGPPAIVISTVR